ncbi:Arylsulfatase precursor [Planctomycetes bacterium MalM25]|nr:Arylsulfatase precursor [Planctomycetes bacterium MalM25]
MPKATLLGLLLIFAAPLALAEDSRPNLVLILADDLGIEGLGCYGGVSYRTPNLDRLAENGVRFTRAYAQPLCTPTRVQLMTGRYNHRNWLAFGLLKPGERTFGHALSDAGYATGIFGKWQLTSYDPPEFPGAAERRSKGMHPKETGFDEYALFHALHTEDKGSRYANPTMLEGRAGEPGELNTYPGRYGEDVWVEKILKFFDRHADRPRFVYYPMALPHSPFEPTPDSADWAPDRPAKNDPAYAADMIEYTDTAVGKLMAGLEERGAAENTIVLFYCDNGTDQLVASRMRDGRTIRGGKGKCTQTGIHVPLIVHCPARFQPAVVGDLVDASDFFPTLLDLADAKHSRDALDGVSFAAKLTGDEGPTRDAAFFWYDPRPGVGKESFERSVFAVNKTHKLFRDGRLYRLGAKPLKEERIGRDDWQLEDLAAAAELQLTIDEAMKGVVEPPMVDAYGAAVTE